MKFKMALRYQLSEYKKGMIIFFSIMLGLLILTFCLAVSVSDSADSFQSNALDFCSMIFILIAGLGGFKEIFRMLLQNGVSRKTMFMSMMNTSLLMAAVVTVVDLLFYGIASIAFNVFLNETMSVSFAGFIPLLYEGFMGTQNTVMQYLTLMVYYLLAHMALCMIGGFFGVLFSNIGKAAKLCILIGIPAVLFVILPLLDYYFEISIFTKLGQALDYCFGISAQSPYRAFISFAVLSVVFPAVTWPLMRRTTVKD